MHPYAIRLAAALLALLVPAFAPAQPSDLVQPQVWIAPVAGQQPVRLADVDIQIRTRGFLALTTLELRFDNPNARVLEGEFVFPLAAGQTVAGYALEVDGAMREGVVVDKQTARVAFEDISRQQIDPGLAEITAGNVFRTRLYPIPARGSKRVRLHLVATLSDVGSDWRYHLPLHFKDPVQRLHVRVEAQLAASRPIADDLAADPDLRFDASAENWVAEFTRRDARPRSELAFRLPKGKDSASQIEAVDAINPAWRSVVALIDSGRPEQSSATVKPRRIALFYDASGSARERQRDREQAALAAYLRQLGQVEVLLLAFRNDADPVKRFRIRAGRSEELLAAIDSLALDGGSSYGAISLAGMDAVDQVLVIGDGLSNFGPAEPHLTDARDRAPPVHVLLAAQRADHGRLGRIARAGGGLVIDLAQTNAEDAAKLLGQRSWRLLAAHNRQGECRMISPQAPTPVVGQIAVHAQCRGRAELVLRFGYGEGDNVERVVTTGRAEPVDVTLAERVHQLWAQAWIGELQAAAQPDQSAIDQLGKRYSVVTSGTSLLVLDRIEDYVRYRVEPKEADLRAQYRSLLAAQPKTVADPGRAARIAQLLAKWQEFRDYHARDYPGVETVLLPMANAERSAWPDSQDKNWRAGRQEAEQLVQQAQSLVQRWPKDGAEDASRARWEREAAQLVLAIEALRQRRSEMPQIAAEPSSGPVVASEMAEWDDVVELSRMVTDRSERLSVQARRADAGPASAMAPAMASSAPPSVSGEGMETVQVRESVEDAAKQSEAGGATPQVQALAARIQLSGWNPDAPYLEALRASKEPYLAHLELRDQYAGVPSYYLDVADYLRSEAKQPRLALRVLSNLAELDTENTALVRVLAYRLSQWELHALAVPQFELALQQRAEEPQSYRDLALALARQQQPDRARAVDLLWQVASGEWHDRFPDIEIIALHELNDVLANASNGEVDVAALGIDARLLDPVAVGLRVVLSWDADNTDIDLWVVDPSGDKAVYNQPRTRTGGYMSRDFTGGYGPEVYTIRKPLPGTYIVLTNYFGDRRQSLTGPVTIQLEFQTRFGTTRSERIGVTRRLESNSQTIEIGRFTVGE